MIDVYARLAELIDPLGIPHMAEEYITPGPLPDEYITYTIVADTPRNHYDNAEARRGTLVQVSYWSRDGGTVFLTKNRINQAVREGGFLYVSGRAAPFYHETRHYGYWQDFRLTERI